MPKGIKTTKKVLGLIGSVGFMMWCIGTLASLTISTGEIIVETFTDKD